MDTPELLLRCSGFLRMARLTGALNVRLQEEALDLEDNIAERVCGPSEDGAGYHGPSQLEELKHPKGGA